MFPDDAVTLFLRHLHHLWEHQKGEDDALHDGDCAIGYCCVEADGIPFDGLFIRRGHSDVVFALRLALLQ